MKRRQLLKRGGRNLFASCSRFLNDGADAFGMMQHLLTKLFRFDDPSVQLSKLRFNMGGFCSIWANDSDVFSISSCCLSAKATPVVTAPVIDVMPSSICFTISKICAVALADPSASFRISSATTANPFRTRLLWPPRLRRLMTADWSGPQCQKRSAPSY